MNHCDRTGCNAPQGECASNGACMTHSMFSSKARCLHLHRVHTLDLPDDRAAVVMGRTDELPIQYAGKEPDADERLHSLVAYVVVAVFAALFVVVITL